MEILLVRPENNEQLKAVKSVLKVLKVDFIAKKEKAYDPEFVEKIHYRPTNLFSRIDMQSSNVYYN